MQLARSARPTERADERLAQTTLLRHTDKAMTTTLRRDASECSQRSELLCMQSNYYSAER